MAKESSKAKARRVREGYWESVFAGSGIDIGCGDDPVTPDCARWDWPNGDAQELAGIAPESFDWVYSSHCLEHVRDPVRALTKWWEILRPGGRMLIVVPDEDLYEQGIWPSRFNGDHKWSFTVHKTQSWSPVSVNVMDLVQPLPRHRVAWIRTIDSDYDHGSGVWDRTLGAAEANIEALVFKIQIGPHGRQPAAIVTVAPSSGGKEAILSRQGLPNLVVEPTTGRAWPFTYLDAAAPCV